MMSEYEPTWLGANGGIWSNPIEDKVSNVAAANAQLVADRATKLPNLTCFIDQFPLAMAAIANVHDYARGPLVKGDYRPSMLRHLFKIGEHPDHDAAAVWNGIAQLEIKLREARSVDR